MGFDYWDPARDTIVFLMAEGFQGSGIVHRDDSLSRQLYVWSLYFFQYGGEVFILNLKKEKFVSVEKKKLFEFVCTLLSSL